MPKIVLTTYDEEKGEKFQLFIDIVFDFGFIPRKGDKIKLKAHLPALYVIDACFHYYTSTLVIEVMSPSDLEPFKKEYREA